MLIELLHNRDCPNAEATWSLLTEVADALAPDAERVRREVPTFKKALELEFPGSPTIRVDGRDLEGPLAPREPSLTARGYETGTGVPPRWLLEAALLRARPPAGVLFLCVANSARSQLGEGIARRLAPAQVRVLSAGSEPAPIRTETQKVLASMGIDASGHSSKSVDTIDPALVDTVITLCAEEACPLFLGKARRLHWGLPDPAGVEGTPVERLNAFFRTASELQRRLEVVWKPEPAAEDEAARADALRREVSAFYADAVAYGAGDGGAGPGSHGASCGSGGGSSGCCGSSSGCCSLGGTAGLAGYDARAFVKLPSGMRDTTFGCGDPVSMAELAPGQTVLDLGCGAGLDLLLAADQVGPAGRVIGVDMTPRMLEQARRNVDAAGFTNVELLQGTIEALPVEDASVDWVLSNCVINLSPEKPRVFAELARVLRPGGHVRVSDITAEDLPAWARNSLHLYASCVAGALPVQDFLDGLTTAGLEDARALSMHVYSATELESLLGTAPAATCDDGCADCDPQVGSTWQRRLIASVTGKIASVTFTARKPG